MAEQSAPPAEGPRMLQFRCGGERFAIDVGYVSEIFPIPAVEPVPFVPDAIEGILNHRGTVCTLLRFARLAGLGPDRPQTTVLLRLPEMAVGLAVDEVEGIELIAGAPALAVAEALEPPTVPFLSRAGDSSGRLVHAIDPELLLEAICQLPAQAREGER